MTTPHAIKTIWAGETVAVLASGPSLTKAVADSLRKYKTIAVNYAHRLAPWADVLLALDGNWPQAYREFVGTRMTGVEDEALDALYIGPRWETVQLSPTCKVEIHNSGLTAVRIAADMGASHIVLAGFDHPKRGGHFYDDEVDNYTGLTEAMAALIAELAAKGIAVEKHNKAKRV